MCFDIIGIITRLDPKLEQLMRLTRNKSCLRTTLMLQYEHHPNAKK